MHLSQIWWFCLSTYICTPIHLNTVFSGLKENNSQRNNFKQEMKNTALSWNYEWVSARHNVSYSHGSWCLVFHWPAHSSMNVVNFKGISVLHCKSCFVLYLHVWKLILIVNLCNQLIYFTLSLKNPDLNLKKILAGIWKFFTIGKCI